jgi:ABC-type transport system involved in cytochrome c biogenesis permease subunit
VVTLRTIVAFITFFGLGGLAAIQAGHPGWPALVTALISGSVAFAVAAALLLQFNRLRSSGTVDIKNAVGAQATVYLTVPAGRTGTGSVTVLVQGRTMQFKAITAGAEIRTGKLCKVTSVVGSDTLEVETL